MGLTKTLPLKPPSKVADGPERTLPKRRGPAR